MTDVQQHFKAQAYALVKGDRAYWGQRHLVGAKIVKITQNKPSNVPKDHIAVKVVLTIPASLLEGMIVVQGSLSTEQFQGVDLEVAPA